MINSLHVKLLSYALCYHICHCMVSLSFLRLLACSMFKFFSPLKDGDP